MWVKIKINFNTLKRENQPFFTDLGLVSYYRLNSPGHDILKTEEGGKFSLNIQQIMFLNNNEIIIGKIWGM